MTSELSVPDLGPTPGQTVGPFYGYALPYPRDRQLVPGAAPEAIRLHGTVLDGAGAPIPDCMLELRQADVHGRIPHVEGSIRRDGSVFTGWGRSETDAGGRYSFVTVTPGPTRPGAAAFFAFTVFARGLLDRLFTRAYVPGDDDALAADPVLSSLDPERRSTLIAAREDDGSLRFDIRLQGEDETTFLSFPRHRF